MVDGESPHAHVRRVGTQRGAGHPVRMVKVRFKAALSFADGLRLRDVVKPVCVCALCVSLCSLCAWQA